MIIKNNKSKKVSLKQIKQIKQTKKSKKINKKYNFNNKIYIFGDSFCESFKILNNKNLRIYALHGKTLKGITKENHANRKLINKLLKKNYKQTKGVVLFFGFVDTTFSYYHNYLTNESEKNSLKNISIVIKKYYDYINDLSNKYSNITFTVINPILNPIRRSLYHTVIHLIRWHKIEKLDDKTIDLIKKYFPNNIKFFLSYSNVLDKYFKVNNKNKKIKYVNFNKFMLNNFNNKDKMTFKQEYVIANPLDHDVIYEPFNNLFIKHILNNIYKFNYKINTKYDYINNKQKQIAKIKEKYDYINNNDNNSKLSDIDKIYRFWRAYKKYNATKKNKQ